ncbi:MAG: peptidylprolyl isomerase [Pseudomonadota bacterium]|nr:peptidylprolyl isomerase [Pseudomonadota bacterium]
MKNQLLASSLGLLLACLPLSHVAAQEVLDMVCFETNMPGEFCVRLYPEDAPETVANFLKYVNDGDYDNTIIHRNPPSYDFVIQGGGFSFRDGVGFVEVPKDPPVVNEFRRSNTRGTITMAKAEGNPNSATSEWFINLSDNNQGTGDEGNLDAQNGGFTVFGEVVTGWNVIDEIVRQPVFALNHIFGPAFANVPMLNFDSSFVSSDFITITRAYQTQRDPNAPTGNDPFPNLTATASFQNTAFFLPVQWTDGKLYRMLLVQDASAQPMAFTVATTLITTLTDKGQSRATYDGNYMTIPSVKIPGGIVTDVRLRLTNRETLEFALESFNRYTGEGPLPQ